jgi:hypothetical protein
MEMDRNVDIRLHTFKEIHQPAAPVVYIRSHTTTLPGFNQASHFSLPVEEVTLSD